MRVYAWTNHFTRYIYKMYKINKGANWLVVFQNEYFLYTILNVSIYCVCRYMYLIV